MIPINIPHEWYGRDIEVIIFPIDIQTSENKTLKFKEIPPKYLFDTKKFKFNRDEANDYE
jgi:hypothetical protein